ncbi:FtsX-like permease family protein [Flavobacterium sp. Fl-77]|uniref:FtsX-like permease family protein n=1 Tax=Flavobacterium flavipigmentatum TaxID=2893884 RepID=A0AAJ2S512_9FLAO|nr:MULTISPECIES: FtsX-like permease family protein [unclassified Flavobacterium]MDX6181022.1 FtsX-like permease family protein [Flavobacterium sp. Fl-33]MDX6184623.1 FtsX-like permease family protein [Flavobacterium sp. Fl-77]UFH39725.1 ABC transporter permease [Flavobacterium sp. F-70]
MNFPLYIAKRYIFSRSKNSAINIINYIASMGIIVGTMALFVVLSVFSGLKVFSLSFTNEIDPDLKATSTYGKSFLITPSQEAQIKNIDGVVSYTKIIEERVLFLFKNKQQVTYIKGVDRNYAVVNDIKKKLFNGEWLKPDTYQVVIGYGIARDFSMGILDFENPLQIFAPKPGKGNLENPQEAFNKTEVLPIGIYSVSEELDSKYVFADLGLVQELLMYKPNQISGIELNLKDEANESAIKSKLEIIFKNKITLKNRAQLNESLYKMLNTENIAVYLIFTLVIIVALFNLIGALIMMILDKKANLKTLFNLGTEIHHLRKIFLLQGTLLSVIGGIVGLVLGIILVLLQQQYELIMITPTLPYPVVFTLENVLIVMATIVSLGFVASLIASSRVSKKLLN